MKSAILRIKSYQVEALSPPPVFEQPAQEILPRERERIPLEKAFCCPY